MAMEPKDALYQHFTTEFEQINPTAEGSTVQVRSSCADITFINFHPSATVYVNNLPLGPAPAPGLPGASLTISANRYEYNESGYSCVTVVPANDSNGKATLGLWCIRKHYTKLLKGEERE